jgi:sterol 24-C-methyltransferase
MSKLKFWGYRLATICKSLKTLYTLSPEQINAFLDSYDVYDNDWANEDQLIEKMGPDYYNKMKKKLIDWYSVLNHLCAIGQVEKMYIPPAMDLSKSIIANQILFEEKMGRDLGVKRGDHVLDIGCGRGRVASHIASVTGANITGMNIDQDQLQSANMFTRGHGLSEQCQFRMGDLNEIPFPFNDNSLDGIYHIQVFSLSKNLEKLFAELYRMLKPGAKFACLDWVRLDKYDENNVRHVELMRKVKPLIGAIGTPSAHEYVRLLQKAGFKIIRSENASIDGLQAPLIENADKFFTRINRAVQFLVRWRFLPRHFKLLFDRLTKDGRAFIEADRERLITTSHYIVAEKP